MRTRAVGAALLVLTLSVITACSLPHVGTTALGIFVPSQKVSDEDALAAKLGVSVQGFSGYTSTASWGAIGSYQPPDTALRLYLGVAMAPSGSSPAQTPANLDVYEELGRTLVADGQSYAILRVGWEWSMKIFPWGVQNTTPAQYVTAFDDIVTAMRSVPGEHFLFDWCAVQGAVPTNGSYAASYPGDQYVDYIGTDVYDNPTVSWADGLISAGGLSSTVAFAEQHGKYVSIPEWGLDGYDDPTFIDDMHGFIADPANHVAYSSYFSDDGVVNSDITQFPASAAAFHADFG